MSIIGLPSTSVTSTGLYDPRCSAVNSGRNDGFCQSFCTIVVMRSLCVPMLMRCVCVFIKRLILEEFAELPSLVLA